MPSFTPAHLMDLALQESPWQPSAPQIGVQIFLGLLGLFWLVRGIQTRDARPPAWVATYRGKNSPTNATPWLGVALLGLSLAGVSVPGLPWVQSIPGLIMIVGVLVWLVGAVVYFPQALLPGWYRAAKDAGVNVQDPNAVQAFRDSRQGAA